MDHIDISVTILLAGLVSFPTCLYNASGPRGGTAEAMATMIAASPATGAVWTKSATFGRAGGQPRCRESINKATHASVVQFGRTAQQEGY
jgi:dihydroorotate dehydrogenase